MRVVSWNIAWWKPAHFKSNVNRRRIWGEIVAMGADIYLLQEVNVADFANLAPRWFQDDFELIDDTDNGQGSCLVVRKTLDPQTVSFKDGGFLHGFRSRIAIARLTFPDGYERVVASVHPSARELTCLLYTSPSPRDQRGSRMPSSA